MFITRSVSFRIVPITFKNYTYSMEYSFNAYSTFVIFYSFLQPISHNRQPPSYNDAKQILLKALEGSQSSAYWHCRLLFQVNFLSFTTPHSRYGLNTFVLEPKLITIIRVFWSAEFFPFSNRAFAISIFKLRFWHN